MFFKYELHGVNSVQWYTAIEKVVLLDPVIIIWIIHEESDQASQKISFLSRNKEPTKEEKCRKTKTSNWNQDDTQ